MEPARATAQPCGRQISGREMPAIDSQSMASNQFMGAAQITQSARIMHSH